MQRVNATGEDFNPRPVCTGRPDRRARHRRGRRISTHAPYVRGDAIIMTGLRISLNFNPRPVCTGRPARGADGAAPDCDFNPRPVCTGRLKAMLRADAQDEFQPTPRMYGATRRGGRCCLTGLNFNPRPVCTGRHDPAQTIADMERISTHAPYVRGDAAWVRAD